MLHPLIRSRRRMAGAKGARLYLCLLVAFTAIASFSCNAYLQVEDMKEKDDIMYLCKHEIARKIGSPWNAKPHTDCCKKVKQVNVQEICRDFTVEDKHKIDLWMWAAVTRNCGNPLPEGYDCSGYIVPPHISSSKLSDAILRVLGLDVRRVNGALHLLVKPLSMAMEARSLGRLMLHRFPMPARLFCGHRQPVLPSGLLRWFAIHISKLFSLREVKKPINVTRIGPGGVRHRLRQSVTCDRTVESALPDSEDRKLRPIAEMLEEDNSKAWDNPTSWGINIISCSRDSLEAMPDSFYSSYAERS
ncbi:hypothetical protein EJB05_33111, partial [Eragrostis curvula]